MFFKSLKSKKLIFRVNLSKFGVSEGLNFFCLENDFKNTWNVFIGSIGNPMQKFEDGSFLFFFDPLKLSSSQPGYQTGTNTVCHLFFMNISSLFSRFLWEILKQIYNWVSFWTASALLQQNQKCFTCSSFRNRLPNSLHKPKRCKKLASMQGRIFPRMTAHSAHSISFASFVFFQMLCYLNERTIESPVS